MEPTEKQRKYFFAASFVLFYLFFELVCRLVLTFSMGAPFFKPSDLIYKYYPQLPAIQKANVSNTDDKLDILILSCSVLHKDWGDIIAEMNKEFKLPPNYKALNLYNASGIGHGSLDNLYKYELLKDKKFDAIIYYDAINDARLNNCPPAIYHSDYSHYLWYAEINNLLHHAEINYTVVPFFLDWLIIKAHYILGYGYENEYYTKNGDWIEFGKDFRSLQTYHKNLDSIAGIAQRNNTRLLYFSFLHYLPKDYTLEKFKLKTLDYSFCDHSRETEIWGLPPNVEGFINAVNDSSGKWLSSYKNAEFIDIRGDFEQSGKNFADICHFSPQGLHTFAAILNKKVEEDFGGNTVKAGN